MPDNILNNTTTTILIYRKLNVILLYTLKLYIFLFCTKYAESQISTNKIYNNNIHTVQLYKLGHPQSYPILNLNNNEKLELSFDDLNSDVKNYNYSIQLCNADWNPSTLQESEYIVGINQNPIPDYHFSFNTTTDYVHYKVELPNNNFKIKYSGNYIIKVYDDFNIDKPVLTWRFIVSEQNINIHAQVSHFKDIDSKTDMQEINITIKHSHFPIYKPLEEVNLSIIQNQRGDNIITNIKPLFIKKDELIYNYNRKLIFEGGNEYRWLDLRSTRFYTDKIKNISFHDSMYHIELFTDSTKYETPYFFKHDFNGYYIIETTKDTHNTVLKADYVMVHFNLAKEKPITNGNVYIIGGLSNFNLNKHNKMLYNAKTKKYEFNILLKQGLYNYMFAFKPNNKKKATLIPTEGSHQQTENNYLIIVYYRDVNKENDRVVGVKQINSFGATTPRL